jgi:hypothetical protein
MSYGIVYPVLASNSEIARASQSSSSHSLEIASAYTVCYCTRVDHNRILVDAVLTAGDFTDSKIRAIHRCRLYLSGRISFRRLQRCRPQNRPWTSSPPANSQLIEHDQVTPSLTVRRRFLRRGFTTNRRSQILGPWKCPDHRIWPAHYLRFIRVNALSDGWCLSGQLQCTVQLVPTGSISQP